MLSCSNQLNAITPEEIERIAFFKVKKNVANEN